MDQVDPGRTRVKDVRPALEGKRETFRAARLNSASFSRESLGMFVNLE